MNVGSCAQNEIVAVQSGHFRKAHAGLDGKEKKRVVATPTPGGLIGCRKQVLNFGMGEKANQSAGQPFIWNG